MSEELTMDKVFNMEEILSCRFLSGTNCSIFFSSSCSSKALFTLSPSAIRIAQIVCAAFSHSCMMFSLV